VARRVLVLSDIDGTLVAHPFLSGKNLDARRESVHRMFNLFSHPNFGIVTGRRKEGFERFFAEYDLEYRLPAFLGVEFATHHAVHGEWVVWKEQSALVRRVMQSLQRVVEANAEFGKGHDVFQALRAGKIETYFLEEKTVCAQIEAHFPEAALQRRFFSLVEDVVNPLAAGNAGLALQGFFSMGRLDILEKGFVPKAGFWGTIEKYREDMSLAPDSELTVVALGDELYDSYMFRYLRSELGEKFGKVFTVSVGKVLAHATHWCRGTDDALSFVERVLAEDFVTEKSLSSLEVA
jgi:hypothetical protein